MTDNHRMAIAIEAAKQLRLHITYLVAGENLTLSDADRQTIADSFEGETTLDTELENAVKSEDDDLILVLGIKQRIEELKGRLDRIEKRIEARRGLIEQAMITAGWPKKETPLGTVSLKPNPPSVEIDDESAVPTQFFKRQDPVLDKATLRAILTARHKAIEEAKKLPSDVARAAKLANIEQEQPPIPGCHLNVGAQSLTIRRK